MDFVQEDQKEDQYSDNNREEEAHEYQEEEEEDDEVRNISTTIQTPLSFCASSSGYIHNNNNLQLMDYLSLKSSSSTTTASQSEEGITENINNNNNDGVWLCGGGGVGGGGGGGEREHMFDKVVTPSDVGKLNRLVIPKQHAEKYFPLDSAANEKGLLLNFEDRNGKPWRFRYSYWNSSQSYVMTKGWSRFVKEKKLDAGDIVSFERGVGDSGKGRLYIDWRRRPHHLHHHFPIDHHHQQQYHSPYAQSVRWGGGGGSGGGGGLIYSLPSSVSVPMPPPRQHENFQYNYDIQTYPYHHHHHHPYHHQYPPPRHHHQYDDHHHHQHHHQQHQISGIHNQHNMNNYQVGMSGNVVSPMVIESMPAAVAMVGHHGHHHGKNAPPVAQSKRLRLFGVNMEYCPKEDHQESDVTMASLLSTTTSTAHDHDHHHLIPSSSASFPHQVRLPNNPSPLPITNLNPAEFSVHKGKSASLSFDLDP